MAEKNIQMTQRNASNTGWDELYPITKAENVKTSDGRTVAAHLADGTSHVFYGVASGTNAKTITLNPAPTSLVEGFALSFKNTTANTGAVTLNVNGLGAKPIKKANGSDVSSGNLMSGGIYTVRYDGSAFILQGESEVEIGQQIITPSTVNQPILKGIHDGTGYVEGSVNLLPENIKEGVNVFGVIGNLKPRDSYMSRALSVNLTKTWQNYEVTHNLGFVPTYVIMIYDAGIRGEYGFWHINNNHYGRGKTGSSVWIPDAYVYRKDSSTITLRHCMPNADSTSSLNFDIHVAIGLL